MCPVFCSRRSSALGALGGRLLAGLGPPVSAHVPVLVQMPPRLPAHDQCMLSRDISACSAT